MFKGPQSMVDAETKRVLTRRWKTTDKVVTAVHRRYQCKRDMVWDALSVMEDDGIVESRNAIVGKTSLDEPIHGSEWRLA